MTDPVLLQELMLISGRLGNVEGQNERIIEEQKNAARGRKEMHRMHGENRQGIAEIKNDVSNVADDVKELKPKVAVVADVARKVADLEPIVTDLDKFRIKLAIAALSVSAVVTGAINLIVLAIVHFSQIKDAFKNLLK